MVLSPSRPTNLFRLDQNIQPATDGPETEHDVSRAGAYVLVQTDAHTDRIARSLRTVPGVVFADDVRGPYDALALTSPNGAAETLERILDEIRALPGVIRVLAAPLVPAAAELPSISVA